MSRYHNACRLIVVAGYEPSGNTIMFGNQTYTERTLNDMVDGDFFRKFRAWRLAHTDVTDRAAAFEQFMRDEGYPEFSTTRGV